MNTELIGMISGGLIALSIIPYSVRTWQRKIRPNVTSWTLWSVIGLALLLTYKDSGAKDNVWVTVFGFINPLLIMLIALGRQYERTKLSRIDKFCLIFGLIAIVMWFFMKESKELVQYALYVALIADGFASIPTIVFLWESPDQDRPFAWSLFAAASGLNIFAISDFTFANLILPIYMVITSLLITVPLYVYRLRKRTPIEDWI